MVILWHAVTQKIFSKHQDLWIQINPQHFEPSPSEILLRHSANSLLFPWVTCRPSNYLFVRIVETKCPEDSGLNSWGTSCFSWKWWILPSEQPSPAQHRKTRSEKAGRKHMGFHRKAVESDRFWQDFSLLMNINIFTKENISEQTS